MLQTRPRLLLLMALTVVGVTIAVQAYCHSETPIPQSCAGCSADAVNLAARLNQLGFRCEQNLPANYGPHCQGRVTGYSQLVHIFISAHLYVANHSSPAVAYHFHGWRPSESVSPVAGPDGNFGGFLASARRNLLVVLPESLGKNVTYARELDTPVRTNAFFQQIDGLLNRAGTRLGPHTPRLISGHSGAYVILAKLGQWAGAGQIPYFKHLVGTSLLDTAYGYRDSLSELNRVMCNNSAGAPATYMVAYNPTNSSSKRMVNERILRDLKASYRCDTSNVIQAEDRVTSHIGFPAKYLSPFWAAALTPLY